MEYHIARGRSHFPMEILLIGSQAVLRAIIKLTGTNDANLNDLFMSTEPEVWFNNYIPKSLLMQLKHLRVALTKLRPKFSTMLKASNATFSTLVDLNNLVRFNGCHQSRACD